MSIKAAFLLSLLVTPGFETVDARRLNRDKLKKVKRGLGVDEADTLPDSYKNVFNLNLHTDDAWCCAFDITADPEEYCECELKTNRGLDRGKISDLCANRGAHWVKSSGNACDGKNINEERRKAPFTYSWQAVSADTQYQMKVESVVYILKENGWDSVDEMSEKYFDVGDAVYITSMFDNAMRVEVAVIAEMDWVRGLISFADNLKHTHAKGARVAKEAHKSETMTLLSAACSALTRQLKGIHDSMPTAEASPEEIEAFQKFKQLIRDGRERLSRMVLKIDQFVGKNKAAEEQLKQAREEENELLKQTADEARYVLGQLD